jgi:predicted O-methyltransferase YrrM
MTNKDPAAVDAYITQQLLSRDGAEFTKILEANAKAGLPSIDVSPPQGKFLSLIARIHGARRILEVGTLGGYSTLWFANALPEGGRIVTIERMPKHAEVAKANLERAGVAKLVDIRVGAALEVLAQLEKEITAPFDLVFIDADKANNPHYVEWALKLTRPGSIIIVDNVIRHGEVLNETSDDANVQGTRAAFTLVASHPRLDATAIQTVGLKGHDGFLLALVK